MTNSQQNYPVCMSLQMFWWRGDNCVTYFYGHHKLFLFFFELLGFQQWVRTHETCRQHRLSVPDPWYHLKSFKMYGKTCVKRPLSKRPKIGFQDQLSLNAGQKYCRMLQGEHSAILLTFIKLPIVIKSFVLSIFEPPFYCNTIFNLHFKIDFLIFLEIWLIWAPKHV